MYIILTPMWTPAGGFYERIKFERLILLHEANLENLRGLADLTNTTTESLLQDIKMLREKMSPPEYSKRVRWLKTVPTNLMTFYNPENEDGWVFIQHLVPYEIANERFCFIVRKQENQKLFERFKQAYDKLWDSLENEDNEESSQ